MKKLFLILVGFSLLTSCERPEPNYEGILMTDYGRNGVESFHLVTGAQWVAWFGRALYEVPMWEQSGDPDVVEITAKDAGVFRVDPLYTYTPIRGKGREIVFNYKNYNIREPEQFFENIERHVLNKRVTDAYREEDRNYTTDSLMNNLGKFEVAVQERLKTEFENKFFNLTTLTSGLTPPSSMLKAVEDRNKAIQEANRVKNELETSRMLLEKAKIDAETNRTQSSGLTKEILMQQYIEMLKSTNNKVIITDGRTPVILGN